MLPPFQGYARFPSGFVAVGERKQNSPLRLSYRKCWTGFRLYSVGPNLKDDGGQKEVDAKDDIGVATDQ
jgi:hypothetical protein